MLASEGVRIASCETAPVPLKYPPAGITFNCIVEALLQTGGMAVIVGVTGLATVMAIVLVSGQFTLVGVAMTL